MCRRLADLAGLLVSGAAPYTDLMHVRRRGRGMTLAASMQWDLLPPLTLRSSRAVVTGLLEPAYEVAGDAFDYAHQWPAAWTSPCSTAWGTASGRRC